MLILPGDPLFLPTLATPPPEKGKPGYAYVCRAGSDVLELVEDRELNEYLEGGEYDDRLMESDGNIDYTEDDLVSDILYLPTSIQLQRT